MLKINFPKGETASQWLVLKFSPLFFSSSSSQYKLNPTNWSEIDLIIHSIACYLQKIFRIKFIKWTNYFEKERRVLNKLRGNRTSQLPQTVYFTAEWNSSDILGTTRREIGKRWKFFFFIVLKLKSVWELIIGKWRRTLCRQIGLEI